MVAGVAAARMRAWFLLREAAAGPQAPLGTAPPEAPLLAQPRAGQPAQAQVWLPQGEVVEEVEAVELVVESGSW